MSGPSLPDLLRNLALGVIPRGHEVFHHGTLFDFELVFDRVRMVQTHQFEKFLEVLIWLSCLVLEIALGGHDILLVRVIRFLVIVVAAGSSCDMLGALIMPPFATFLSTFADGFGWSPPPPRLVPGTVFPSP
jgi:hypothetical protein